MSPRDTDLRIRRARAADILDEVRVLLARRHSPEAIESELNHRFGIEPLVECRGEAHSDANIDHCMVCAPRWGWTGPRIKIT